MVVNGVNLEEVAWLMGIAERVAILEARVCAIEALLEELENGG